MKKNIFFKAVSALISAMFSAFPLAASPVIKTAGTINGTTEMLENGKAKYVSIFAINDFHGSVEEDIAGKNPGAAKLGEVLDELRNEEPASIIVSAGDNYQGSALSNLSKGKVVSDFFRYEGVAASAVGNHEFDWTDTCFPEWTDEGGFEFLAANLIYKPTGICPSWCRPYSLFRIGGHLIAVIGAVTHDTLCTAGRENIKDYDFPDAAEYVRKTLRQIQALYHPEAVVVLCHIGSQENLFSPGNVITSADSSELEDLCRVTGIDAVITGHSHELVNGRTHEVPVVQAQNYGRAVGIIRFKFTENGLARVYTDVIDVSKIKNRITGDAEAASIVGAYKSKYGAQLGEKVAFAEAELSHEETVPNVTPLGYLVASAMKKAFRTDMAITNGGGLRRTIRAGTLTVNDMWELIPFDNTGVVVTVKGADLKKILDHGINTVGFRAGQFAGGKVYYTTKASEGCRINKILLDDGREVFDEGEYTVVVNDFMYEGGDHYDMIKPAALKTDNTYIPFRDAVIGQLKAMGIINKSWSEIPQVLIVE